MTQLSGSTAAPDRFIERRLALGALIVVAIWGALGARLFYLQVLEGERFRISAERNSVRTHRLLATRGMILDRTGEIIVDSRPSFDVLLIPHETPDIAAALERVAGLAGLPLDELLQRVGEPRGRARFQPSLVARDLDRDAWTRVRSRLWALPGVVTRISPIRDYRRGKQIAHALGVLGEISAAQLATRRYQGYRRGDSIGKDGIERLLDRDLRGRDGGRNVLVDAHGREFEELDRIDAQPGHNVILTLDSRLQEVAARQFAALGKNGAVVALDPRNGQVLALMSRPAFEPNQFARGIGSVEWASLRDDPDTPLHDRALQGVYPPGSTYKVVTALAGLETGEIGPDDTVKCTGSYRLGRRRYRCWKRSGHGTISLHRALVESCDVYFYRLGHAVGVDKLGYYARALGLGSPTGIRLPGEASGLVPTRAWKERRFGEPWLAGETISLSIGQGFNLWTPIQMAAAYAVIANGGTRFRPYVVQRVEDVDGRIAAETLPEVLGSVPISERSLELVRRGLRGVVHDAHGTGYAMRGLPVESAGKTGTAQVVALAQGKKLDSAEIPEAHRDHAWFVGYAPADAPRIVVAVLVEHGGHGGAVAAPIVRAIIEKFLEQPAPAASDSEELHARN